ncbi:MAG TPA: DNA polymerase III subunit alpha, partial [Ktedonobacterales bacterium]
MAEFTHLHVHSEYSLLDGQSRLSRLVEATKAGGMSAVALTDHGGMYGAIEFHKAAMAAGIRPILGVEAYLAESMQDRSQRFDYNHLLLLARTTAGYSNLLKLTSLAYTKGFHYKPRIDKATLAQYADGLIVTSGCLSGEIPEMLLKGDLNGARTAARWYQDVFGRENFYIEVQDHCAESSDQVKLNPMLCEFAKEMDAPLVATNDLHYVAATDADAQDVLLCVQMGKTLDDPKRMKFDSKEYYLKTPDEMARLFPELPEALKNTMRIAEQCEVEIPWGRHLLPVFPVPDGFTNQEDYLYHLCLAGVRERYGEMSESVQQKLDYEFGVIREKGFVAYFLIVWDFVNYGRGQGIRCAARGSAAGSLVAYVLGITNVDPLRYALLFERFLNPERMSMPDIDMDFPDDRREDVIRYVAEKYGWDKVAQITTFGTMAAKAAVRDVGRVMGLQSEADRVARQIPSGPGVTLEKAITESRDLRQTVDASPQIQRLYAVARDLEGTVRSTGIHAAGVVISSHPLDETVPLQLRDNKDPKSWLVSQYEQKHLEELGLLKMDFLGLSNLTILQNCQKFIRETRGLELDLDRLPLDDAKAFDLLGQGETTGVFQLESGAMRQYIRELKPTSLEDITAMVALYRPGPMDSIPDFIESKHGRKRVKYLHPALEPLLNESYGVIVYQDQVLLIAVQLAGFSWGEVDKFRKAMSKKIREEMASYREKFVKGCGKHSNIPEKVANEIFDFIEPFAGYGFNKCAHGSTEIQLPDGGRMALSAAYRNPPAQIMAMWPDGVVRPHKVARIVRTGRKALLRIRTASGRSIKVTAAHRLLTTEGYREAGQMRPGDELIVAPRRMNEHQRAARRAMITRLNRSEKQRARVSARVRAYQAARDPEDQRQHMLRMHQLYPTMTRNGMAAAHEHVKWLFANDPAWKARIIARSIASVRECYDTGPGYGRCSIASNGMWCASQPERTMCEWLIEQGIEFELHKVLGNGRVCDFYFNGIYWE